MGNHSSTIIPQKSLEEIRFLLVSHQRKYIEYIYLPIYGLEFFINELKKNRNREFIKEILRNIERWKIDVEFSYNMKTALNQVENEEVYKLFIQDIQHLNNKILEILDSKN